VEFTEATILSLYEKSLEEAKSLLSSLAVAEGRTARTAGLNGWVFEQTIRYCLWRELAAVGAEPQMQEQVPLDGRKKIDLLVGRTAIELKARGSFGAGDSKYCGYRKTVEGRGWIYLYVTMQETYVPYRQATKAMFGEERAFFLDTAGDWKRFVEVVVAHRA
jgi:hypothetical protein